MRKGTNMLSTDYIPGPGGCLASTGKVGKYRG